MARRRTKTLELVPPPSCETASEMSVGDRQGLYIAVLEAQQAAAVARQLETAVGTMVNELAAKYRATGFDPKSGKITRAPAPKDEE